MSLRPTHSRLRFVLFIALIATLFSEMASAAYCTSAGGSTSYEWIDSVKAGNFEKVSGNNGGYADYTSEGPVALVKGDNDLTLTPGFGPGIYTENWYVWIDVDQNQVFSSTELLYTASSNAAVNGSLVIPDTALTGNTRMRVIMSYSTFDSACGSFTWGEAEDYTVNIGAATTPPVADLYTLNIENDYTLTRTGNLGDSVTWVIEKDGAIVLRRSAASEMTFRYWANTSGSNFRAWVERGTANIVSNTIEYTPGQTVRTHELKVAAGYGYEIQRGGVLGEPLNWVIEKDGVVMLTRDASNELNYTYPDNTDGSYFRVWLEQNVNGTDVVVSNVVYYVPGIPIYDFNLTLNKAYDVIRTGALGDPLIWVIEKDGVIVLQRNASNELRYNYFGNTAGANIRVWLKQFINGQYVVVSNTIQYTVNNSINDYALTLGPGYEITRNGNLGDSVSWVIEKNGNIVLERNASNELSYTYYSNTFGAQIRVYLQKFLGSEGYRRVSNIIEYTVQ